MTAPGRASASRRARRTAGPLGLSLSAGTLGAGGVGLGAVLLSGLLGGRRGTVSAVLGLAVVLLFFVLSLYLVEVANRVAPSLTLPVAVTVYSTLVLWLIVLADGTNLPEHLHQGAFAWTVIASTLGWLVLQSIAVWRRRAPYVEVELPTASDEE